MVVSIWYGSRCSISDILPNTLRGIFMLTSTQLMFCSRLSSNSEVSIEEMFPRH